MMSGVALATSTPKGTALVIQPGSAASSPYESVKPNSKFFEEKYAKELNDYLKVDMSDKLLADAKKDSEENSALYDRIRLVSGYANF